MWIIFVLLYCVCYFEGKGAKEEATTQGDQLPKSKDRSVDEIVAALKHQATSGV
jgi:hypothetical protein